MATFWTSDTHFGHTNILKFCARPFPTIEEHDEALVQNWNSVVTPEDTTYVLGDLSLHGWQWVERIVWRLNGSLKVVPGSHDRKWIASFEEAGRSGHWGNQGIGLDKLEILPPLVSLRLPAQEFRDAHVDHVPRCIVLCHYAMRRWDASHRGSWHLYGHSHGRLRPHGLSFDVGVDGHDFRPWSLREVAQKIKSLTPLPVDEREQVEDGEDAGG